MSHNNYFQFKQFKIIQEKAAMKVNTDGVLLGAWTNLDGVKTVLDVGAGTGLIALMIAQRCDAIITGVEIEKNAAEEAVQNVQNSNWGNRVTIQNISFQEFAAVSEIEFDLIVSNPPFFSNGVKNADPNLSMARHNDLLPFTDIISGAVKLLTDTGKLALILPLDQSVDFIEKARLNRLFLNRMTDVKPFPDRQANRCLMEFRKLEPDNEKTEISVFGDSKIDYSEEFKGLTHDFYLKH
jgi:tRNA1Val (adenine37-N6)-methyltransferase